MTYREVLDLPLRVFWTMSGKIHRIQAEEDMRRLSLLVSANSTEDAAARNEALLDEMGEVSTQPIVFERDEEGFEELRKLAL